MITEGSDGLSDKQLFTDRGVSVLSTADDLSDPKYAGVRADFVRLMGFEPKSRDDLVAFHTSWGGDEEDREITF